jgi:hypothetical protein
MEIAAVHEIPDSPVGTLNRSRSVDVAVADALFRSEGCDAAMLCGRFGAASRQMSAHVVALAAVRPVTLTQGSDSQGSRVKH